MSNQSTYLIKDGKKQFLVKVSAIVSIEANEQFAYLRLQADIADDRKYATKHSLKGIEEKLCKDHPCMIRVSKSFIVNMEHIESIQKVPTGKSGKKEVLIFKHPHQKPVAIGRAYKKNIMTYLSEI